MKKDDPFYLRLYQILSSGEPRGVTELARILDVPVATLHRYLKSQNIFTQNIKRKWTLLPEAPKEPDEATLQRHTLPAWPLYREERDIPSDIKQILRNPKRYPKIILQLIKDYEELDEIIHQRIVYLKHLGKLIQLQEPLPEVTKKMSRQEMISRIIQYRLDSKQIGPSHVEHERFDLETLTDEELEFELARFL